MLLSELLIGSPAELLRAHGIWLAGSSVSGAIGSAILQPGGTAKAPRKNNFAVAATMPRPGKSNHSNRRARTGSIAIARLAGAANTWHFADNGSMAAWLLILCAVTSDAAEPAFPSKEMLSAHNAIRSRVGLQPLLWSDNLAKFARDWANTLLARRQFSHRPNSPYGENLFEIVGDVATPQEVVGDWASEARDYDYRSNRCHGLCGHYTQIVWRNTKSVGCAVARGAKREIWVCNYDPPGNYVGQRPY
jgi:pathogenesis-related protein 1